MGEEWKKTMFDGYEVSSKGRVKSSKFKIPRVMKTHVDQHGYVNICLSVLNKKKSIRVHRLVLLTFVGPSDLVVNHKNGIKTDNRLENLEYCTSQENFRHAIKLGLSKYGTPPISRGENHPQSKLSEIQVLEISKCLKPSRATALDYGISKTNVLDIRAKRIWTHLWKDKQC